MSDEGVIRRRLVRHGTPPQHETVARTELSAESDRLNALFTKAELRLSELGLGVSASVQIVYDIESGVQRKLAFGKFSGKWKLVVEVGDPSRPEDWDINDLTNVSREIRVLAAQLLPRLREELHREYEKQLQEVKAAASLVEQFLSELPPGRNL